MSEGIIAVKNTATKFLKGAVDATIRGRFWLSYMREHGRIKIGDSGGVSTTWNVMARQPEVRQNGDAGQQVFAEHDAYEQATIDVRGYVATDRLTLKKKLMNAAPLQIVDLYGTKLENLIKSVTDQFGAELYVDGNATGNSNRLLGLQSFTGNTTTVAADIVADPSDTYAGLSTALGNLGGSWSTNLSTSPNANEATDWPEGSGSTEYDYFSPKLINYSSTGWGTGGTTWRDNCSLVLRRSRLWTQSTSGFDSAPMLHLLSPSLYAGFEDYMEAKFRVVVPHKASQDLGFEDGLNFSGAIVKQDYDCPADKGFGVNVNEMLLFSIHDDMFYSYGPEWDTKSLSYLYLVGFFGNLRFSSPKYFALYDNFA